MNAFRLVAAEQAGPNALGILVPPGRRSVLIVRPRALPWDLLVVQQDRRRAPTTMFREFGREEASAAVEGLYTSLQRWAEGVAEGAVTVDAVEDRYLVRVQVEVFPLVACLRRAGQPYEPLRLNERLDAEDAAASLIGVLHPAPDADQEVYVNDRHFSR